MKPRSDITTKGRRMAGARALWVANGMKPEQMGRPVIAIANSLTQFVPGHTHLHEIGQKVKAEIEAKTCPGCGCCSGMFTANSMNCLCEAIGLALPGNGTVLATHKNRERLFKKAARLIVENAYKSVKAEMTVVGIDSEDLFPASQMRAIAAMLPGSKYLTMTSIYGHDGFLLETGQIELIMKPLGGIIDLLLKASSQAASGDPGYRDTIAEISRRHNDMICELFGETAKAAVLKGMTGNFLSRLQTLCEGIFTLGVLPEKTRCQIVSFGEQMSSRIVTELIDGARLRYETTVGAALPILETAARCLNSGDRIDRIEAVLSGTLNYLFSNYQGSDFAGLVEKEEIPLDEAVLAGLWRKAADEGCRLRFVASLEREGEGYKARMGLRALPESHPFYNLNGTNNCALLTTEFYPSPLVVQGAGAGAFQTASGLLNDILL